MKTSLNKIKTALLVSGITLSNQLTPTLKAQEAELPYVEVHFATEDVTIYTDGLYDQYTTLWINSFYQLEDEVILVFEEGKARGTDIADGSQIDYYNNDQPYPIGTVLNPHSGDPLFEGYGFSAGSALAKVPSLAITKSMHVDEFNELLAQTEATAIPLLTTSFDTPWSLEVNSDASYDFDKQDDGVVENPFLGKVLIHSSSWGYVYSTQDWVWGSTTHLQGWLHDTGMYVYSNNQQSWLWVGAYQIQDPETGIYREQSIYPWVYNFSAAEWQYLGE